MTRLLERGAKGLGLDLDAPDLPIDSAQTPEQSGCSGRCLRPQIAKVAMESRENQSRQLLHDR